MYFMKASKKKINPILKNQKKKKIFNLKCCIISLMIFQLLLEVNKK